MTARWNDGLIARAVPKSTNAKIGDAATTYAAQQSCPTSCPFLNGGGCYAEAGRLGKFVTGAMNKAASGAEGLHVAVAEAAAIRQMEVVPGRPLRLHTVGDCATDLAAIIVAQACEWYMDAGGGAVWAYTHGWRDVARSSWGRVSVLASCETAADVTLAQARGYATAIVVEEHPSDRRYDVGEATAPGSTILPCPAQTRHDVTCTDCRLCMNDAGILERGYSIGFELHGTPFTIRQARKALRTPHDPDRRLTSRELIPRFQESFQAEHGRAPTIPEIACGLDLTRSSVYGMVETLAREREAIAA